MASKKQNNKTQAKKSGKASAQNKKSTRKKDAGAVWTNPEMRAADKYAKFVQWMAAPAEERRDDWGATSQIALSEKLQVRNATLSEWKKRPDFWNEVNRLRGTTYLQPRTSNVLMALYRRCIKLGMAQDVELWLAYVEGWDKKQIVEHQGDALDENDIRALIANIPENERNEYYKKLAEIVGRAEQSKRSAGGSENSASE